MNRTTVTINVDLSWVEKNRDKAVATYIEDFKRELDKAIDGSETVNRVKHILHGRILTEAERDAIIAVAQYRCRQAIMVDLDGNSEVKVDGVVYTPRRL